MNRSALLAEYPYRTRLRPLVFIIGFFGYSAAFMGFKAAANDRGLVINRVIELGPTGATIFFWLVTAGATAFVAIGVGVLLQRFLWPMRVAFTEDSLVVPRGPLSRTEIQISYNAITGMTVYRLNNMKSISIRYADRAYTICGIRFPSDEVVDQIAGRIESVCPQLTSAE